MNRPDVLLEVTDLVVHYAPTARARRRAPTSPPAVQGATLTVRAGEVLGLVGESGSGKSTLARAVLQLRRPSSGSVRWLGQELTTLTDAELRLVRRSLQLVFQNASGALSPRLTVGRALAEPLEVHGLWDPRRSPRRIAELLHSVGLHPDDAHRLPHELSGGQRQRVGIARALVLSPQLLVLDEPVSALDVSVQAGIVNLLQDLQRDSGLSYLFIAHDLAVVRHLCHRVAVMHQGRIVETGTRDEVFSSPQHPYTRSLLAAACLPDPQAERRRRAEVRARRTTPTARPVPAGAQLRQ